MRPGKFVNAVDAPRKHAVGFAPATEAKAKATRLVVVKHALLVPVMAVAEGAGLMRRMVA